MTIGTPCGNENIFGKQRGRFDEVMANRVRRSLSDQCFATFMAMDEIGRGEFAARVTDLFAKAHPNAPKWRMIK